jgi:hypothetical protein
VSKIIRVISEKTEHSRMDVSRGDKNEEEMNRLSGTFDYSGS